MKKIFLLAFLLISATTYGQTPQFLSNSNTNLIVQGVMSIDSPKSTLNLRLLDTTTTKLIFPSRLNYRLARQDGRIYQYLNNQFVLFDSITSSSGGGGITSLSQGYGILNTPNPIVSTGTQRVDTSVISTKANVVALTANKVNYSDTAIMLFTYLRKADTASLSNRINQRVPYTGAISDVNLGTHGLLAHDLVINHSSGSGVAASISKSGSGEALTVVKSSGSGNAASITGGVTLLDELHLNTDLADTYIASSGAWNAKIGASDTAAMLAAYLRKADTSSLSNRINTKLNIADTANIRLRPIAGANMSITGTYPNLTFAASGGGGSADSITFATNYRVDTAKANLRTSINTKLNISDTSAMMAAYLRKGDTASMLANYLRKADTASLSNRINLKVDSIRRLAGSTQVEQKINGVWVNAFIDSVGSGGGGGGVSGSGTTNFLPKFTASTTLGNSQIQDDGTSIGINGAVTSSSNRMQVRGSVAFIGGNFTDNPGGFFGGTVIGNNASQGFIQTYGSTPLVLNPIIGSVGIGVSSPNARALLDVSTAGSTKGGIKFPSFTTTERNAISWVSGDEGMVIWNSTTKKLQVWDGTTWIDLH